jgi:hypothetical protein
MESKRLANEQDDANQPRPEYPICAVYGTTQRPPDRPPLSLHFPSPPPAPPLAGRPSLAGPHPRDSLPEAASPRPIRDPRKPYWLLCRFAVEEIAAPTGAPLCRHRASPYSAFPRNQAPLCGHRAPPILGGLHHIDFSCVSPSSAQEDGDGEDGENGRSWPMQSASLPHIPADRRLQPPAELRPRGWLARRRVCS